MNQDESAHSVRKSGAFSLFEVYLGRGRAGRVTRAERVDVWISASSPTPGNAAMSGAPATSIPKNSRNLSSARSTPPFCPTWYVYRQ
jgi:hypothetical protein